MQDFDIYIPQDRRLALVRGLALPDRTCGAALFADISGFTPLAEALAQELGPQRGAEELTAHLNRLYDALIHCVHQFGGSVIGFSGDAITCWFNSSEGTVGTEEKKIAPVPLVPSVPVVPSLYAVACGLAMQQAMGNQSAITTRGGATFTLAVKVAVASGPARRFLVGDPHIQVLDVLAGHTLDQLATAGRLARRGEVVLDAQTATVIADHVHISGWRADETAQRVAIVSGLAQQPHASVWPDTPEHNIPAKHAQGWLLPAVRERLRHHSAAFLAELRPVVALMLHFQGIDYDHDADAGQMLNSFICAAQHITAHYEGALIDITMGDKGSYLYLTFGAPVAHDDDAARALAAARDLLALPHAMPYITAARIGLARGTMHAGAYGGTQRRTYGVLGDPANLAARLMEAAPDGTAWCDYAVYHAAERRWVFAALPPVRVKGKASAVRVYEPLSERDRHAVTSDVQQTMVGRQAEIAQLAAQLDEVVAGASRMFIIEGEAGIGKSRMVAELVQLLRARGMVGLLGAGKSVEQQTPYRAWRDIFNAYFGLDELTDAAARRARVQAYIAEHLPHLLDRAPILND
ncbi:MAG TPA: BREX system ATP-binding domain-containing protein, partial [Roseiflexaceae bacterium]|nr:BREX system ATP-binding domain-containing protein [Roseiflexaceae bacterium]